MKSTCGLITAFRKREPDWLIGIDPAYRHNEIELQQPERSGKLPEERRRRAPGVENTRPHQRRKPHSGNIKICNLRSETPRPTGYDGWRPLQSVNRTRTLLAGRLSHCALVGGRVFHLGPHGMQIVGSRDHRKQQNQGASQRQQALPWSQPAPAVRFGVPLPQPVCRQRQQHPRQIEE